MKDDSEDGFGLVEIIVAIALLGILLMAVAPLLMGGLRVTAKTTTIATATQIVSQELDEARAAPGTVPVSTECISSAVIDAREVRLTSKVCRSAGTRPKIVEVTATVSTASKSYFFPAGLSLASATTEIYTG